MTVRAREPLVLRTGERERLAEWAAQPGGRLALRAAIVLACAEGQPDTRVAARHGVSRATVAKWRSRFAAARLAGLRDAPRPGTPRKITDEQVRAVLARTRGEPPPDGRDHWTTRTMAAAAGLSQSAVSRIWRAFGLKPHQTDAFKLSPDPQFIDKVRDIVGLYLNPPEAAVVLCVDEKSQIQALDRSAPILPLMPGSA